MSLNFYSFHILTILLLAAAFSFAHKDNSQEVDWKEIDINNPKVVESAKFAVDEHNKQKNTKLEVKSVERAQAYSPRENELELRIFFQASDGKYVADLRFRPWEDIKILISFKRIIDATIN
ncbi:hypothetical protein ACH5RR_014695 [Cinchona calisaya]|uniref:Cystatin domain-containing protein n=1 Tax=Cinchona calisaya TaxID=153742 RepID=A0ABD2ZSP7_9GENT